MVIRVFLCRLDEVVKQTCLTDVLAHSITLALKSRLQRTGQSLTTPKGEEASVGVFHDGDSRRSDHFHMCTAVLDKESIVERNECELARLFVSKNLGNTISAVLHYSGSWINFCLC